MSARVTLYVLTGLPGAGKTRRATEIVAATGAVHVSMDDALRDRGISIVDYETRFALQPDIEATIPAVLEAGRSVVAEFGSWSQEERTRIANLAASSGARTELHWLHAPLEVLTERIRARGGEGAETLATTILGTNSHLFEEPTPDEIARYDRYVSPGCEFPDES